MVGIDLTAGRPTTKKKNAAVTRADGTIIDHDNPGTPCVRSMSMNAPSTKAMTPPAVRIPCVGAKMSVTNNATASARKASPAALTGSTEPM